MTIAACYLSADGVVFGADSTTTIYVSGVGPGAPGSEHHYNFAQKIFQIGENSTLGLTMWGLGNLHSVSYRTLIAQFADSLLGQGSQSMDDVANRWNQFFWTAYSSDLARILAHAQALQSQPTRSPQEEELLSYYIRAYSVGFCIGGYLMNDRTPRAYEILYNPIMSAPGKCDPLAIGRTRFWGCPNLVTRLLYGLDEDLFSSIQKSGKWTGTGEDLYNLIVPFCLGQPFDLPIREAIDWVHASIYTTIKTMKFSHMAPICGGPVEIAVITTDRKFRWVRHKTFDSAIGEGFLYDVHHGTK
ncbi:MAG: hypothetical protein ABSG67_00245 [Thermoguttaceae bacterium]|jgi:hypothetical protein